jgi:hypothetical protein
MAELASSFLGNWNFGKWVNVTYSSNWVDVSTIYSPTSYYKDILGFVHFRLSAKNGSANPVCTLPVGYRSSYYLVWDCYSTPMSTLVPNFYIAPDGTVNVQSGLSSVYYLCGEVIYTPSS